MSTNASIALYDQAKQTVTTIHLSCDGYPSHAGKVLLNHYKTEQRVKSLLKLGDLFSVYPKIPRNLPDLKTFWETAKKNPDRHQLPFGTGLCFPFKYYYNDGERNSLTRTVPAIQKLKGIHPSFGANEHYMFAGGVWYIAKFSNKTGCFTDWKVLTEAMCK